MIVYLFVIGGLTSIDASTTQPDDDHLGALLAGLSIYDKIGTFTEAGSIVWVTGFADN